jgi:glycerol-3-phosphate dehydrogenase subunit B
MRDVVVVGGGLSGCWAAATAAQAGARVTLVRSALGATAVSSGAIDFVPVTEATAAAAWLDRLPRSDPYHPYLVEGTAPLLDELHTEAARLATALEAARLPHWLNLAEPVVVAAITGQVRGAGLIQSSIAAGDLRGADSIAVAGIEGLGRMQPALISAAIGDWRSPRTAVASLSVELSTGDLGAIAGDLDDASVARAVEAPGGAEALGGAIRASLGRARPDRVLLPAVLGLDDVQATASRVEEAAGVAVAELLSPPPSAPGWRLQAACDRIAAHSGVRIVTGSVTRAVREQGLVVAVEAPDGTTHPCDVLILATGKYIGGGLRIERHPCEPLVDLPVFINGQEVRSLGSRDLTDRAHFREQPFAGAGVRCDALGRPVDSFGSAVCDNLLACGALLAGMETTLRGGGLGVAAWTAARAGRGAAELVGAAAA